MNRHLSGVTNNHNKHMKRHTITLVIRECNTKITVRYYSSTRMAVIKKWTITNIGEDVGKLETLIYC